MAEPFWSSFIYFMSYSNGGQRDRSGIVVLSLAEGEGSGRVLTVSVLDS